MKVKFFGARGSTPVCGPEYQEFGGNTTCIEINYGVDNRVAIFDAGTGIRVLGKSLLNTDHRQKEFFILFSHFHWDHIQGLPFFPQAYNPDNRINMMSAGKRKDVEKLKQIFTTQMQSQYFPVQLENMGAEFNFLMMEKVEEFFEVAKVTPLRHTHPGGAYSYRIENNGKVLVLCTDIEHGQKIDSRIVELARGADLLIHDGQYTEEELADKRGWGHSAYIQAIEVAKSAGVKKLVVTHHDPDHNDEFLLKCEARSKNEFHDVVFAREKMVIEI